MDPLHIGWIGTGVMGRSMCSHLIGHGHHLHVYNRTREKAEALIRTGAHWCDSPAEAAENAEVMFAMVGFPRDVEEVVLGPQGLVQGARPGTTIVDMTTSSPDLAGLLFRRARDKGIDMLDAPVSGGDVGAREATLAIMVGGDKAVLKKHAPCSKYLAKPSPSWDPAAAASILKCATRF